MINEKWEKINGYENYTVSNTGRIFNVKRNKELKISMNKGGYMEVSLANKGSNKTLLVHRLVAQSFIKNELNHKCVHHVDSDRTNNNVSNLEWVSYYSNIKYKNDKETSGCITKVQVIKLFKSKEWTSVDDFFKEIIKI
jgi:hypothetical protein